jgi:Yip1-like protein
MALVDRVKAILLTPKNAWTTIDSEPATVGSLYTGYAMLLAAIPALAGFIGWSVVGFGGALGMRFKVPMGTGLTWAIVQYVGSLVGVYLLALIIDALAPNFGGQKNQIQALKVAVYSSTASWVFGIFAILPSLAIIGMLAGLYSLYLLFVGLPILMKAPQEKALGYTVVAVVAAIVVFLLVGALANQVAGFGGWYGRPDFMTP